MRTSKIPQTDSIHELAQFWDTHDLTDFKDQLEEVTEPIFERTPETPAPRPCTKAMQLSENPLSLGQR